MATNVVNYERIESAHEGVLLIRWILQAHDLGAPFCAAPYPSLCLRMAGAELGRGGKIVL